MASTCPLQGRLTTEVHLTSIDRAYQAGIEDLMNHLELDSSSLKGLEKPEDLWKFDPRPRKECVPVGRASKKPTPKWEDDPALADLPFNPELCNCRRWNGGFGAQCNRPKLEDDDLCALHKKNYERVIANGGEDLTHGRFNQERPTHCLAKPDKEHAHPWNDLKVERAAKKDSEKAEKKAKALKEKEEKAKAKAEKKAEKEKAKAEKKALKEKEKEEKKAAKKAEKAAEKAKAAEEAKAAEDAKAAKEAEEAAKAAKEAEEAKAVAESVKDIVDKVEETLEADESQIEEITDKGFAMKWDKKTNFLHDIDDDEVVGRRVKIDGEWTNIMDSDENSDGSDSDSDPSDSSDSSDSDSE